MHNKLHFVSGAIFALVVAHDVSMKIKATNANRYYRESILAYEATQARHIAQIKYLCGLIDNSDIPIDDFDLIMLNDPPVK
jgi:hypothetical protein